MIYFKLESNNQVVDVSITEKEGYVEVDETNEFYPFHNYTLPMICCFTVVIENGVITMHTLAVPEIIYFALKQTADNNIVASGDAETLVNCYELFGGNL